MIRIIISMIALLPPLVLFGMGLYQFVVAFKDDDTERYVRSMMVIASDFILVAIMYFLKNCIILFINRFIVLI